MGRKSGSALILAGGAAVLLGAAALAVLPGCDRSGEAASGPAEATRLLEVGVAPVERRALRTELDLVGTLVALRSTTIVPEVDGVIESFPIPQPHNSAAGAASDGTARSERGLDFGDVVHKGDAMVQLDPSEHKLALEVAKANHQLAVRQLEQLRATQRPEEIERLEAAAEAARAAERRAKSEAGRIQQLLAQRAISPSMYDAAVMEAQTAVANLKQAEAALKLYRSRPTAEELAVAEAQVAAAEAQMHLREDTLAKTTIRAPYDAVVGDRYVEVGDRVTAMPRVEIMQIIDPSLLYAEVAAPERCRGRIRVGDQAIVSVEGSDEPMAGRVARINAKVDEQTRTFRVRVIVDNREGLLKAGGFAHVRLPLETADGVLAVPVEAVSFSEGRPSVFVFMPGAGGNEGRVRQKPVTVGISTRDRIEITSGVSEGERVVVGRTSLLADGLPVRLATPKPQQPAVEARP